MTAAAARLIDYLRLPAPVAVERVVTGHTHLVHVTTARPYLTPQEARALAEELEVAAVEPDVCANCDAFAVSSDGLCIRCRADDDR